MTMTWDRISEIALVLLAGATIWQGAQLIPAIGPSSGDGSRPASATARPTESDLAKARVLVDANDPGARAEILRLTAGFPESPEAWSLAARYHEGAGDAPSAVGAWARALKMDSGLGDKHSPRYLGGRIGDLAGGELQRLREIKRGRGLSPAEKGELDAVYYLRRRLSGGCE